MIQKRVTQTVSALLVLAVWQSVTTAGILGLGVVPPPARIADSLVTLLADRTFRSHIVATVRRTVLATVIAVPAGVCVGIAMGWNDRLKRLCAPFLYAIYPMPVIALLPVLLPVFSTEEQTLIFLAALGGFFILVWNAMTAVEEIHPVHVEAARDNGATSRYALFREVLLPGSLPLVFTGLRLSLNTALLIVISVEFITADSGLGFFVWRSWGLYELSEMYAGIAVIGTLGLGIVYGLGRLQRAVVPWATETDGRLLTP